MNKFIQYAVICVAFGFIGYSAYELVQPLCSKPLRYSIGSFDSGFGITQESFRLVALQAESVWETELEKQAFVYDPTAEFKINLIYDEKQLATVQKQKTESGLSALEYEFEDLDRRTTSLRLQYEAEVEAYEQSLTSFNQRKSSYNKEVSSWNEKGGAPNSVYNDLEKERQSLNREANELNAEAKAVNLAAEKLNEILSERNAKADRYNEAARLYNQKYGSGLEFNQAEYTGKEINVYQFTNERELLTALIHEFGHALGMDHVENPDSVMYYLSTGDTDSKVTLSDEDISELNRVCESKGFLFW
jgi:predicted  nucleic acid-binding Zn-ribbon protein